MGIDTLKYTKHLEAHGIAREQAEAHAEAIDEAVGDLAEMKQDIATLKSDMKWVKWFQGATTAMVMVAGVKFLFA